MSVPLFVGPYYNPLMNAAGVFGNLMHTLNQQQQQQQQHQEGEPTQDGEMDKQEDEEDDDDDDDDEGEEQDQDEGCSAIKIIRRGRTFGSPGCCESGKPGRVFGAVAGALHKQTQTGSTYCTDQYIHTYTII